MTTDTFKDIEKLESDLWEAADLLRANSTLTSSDYFMPVRGVIFLRHAANRFDAAHQQIEADRASGKMPKRKVRPADYIARRSLYLYLWEPKFLAVIVAGGDPRVKPVTAPKASEGLSVADFLDRYCTNYVEVEGLRDPVTVNSRLKGIKRVLGDLPVGVLEKPSEIFRFKAIHRKRREIATVNRALTTLRAAINWGRFQDPPYLTTTSFPSIRREHQSEGGNETRSPSWAAGRAGTASRVLGDERR